jgi:hypothetical protein
MQVTTIIAPAVLRNVPTGALTALTGAIPASTGWIVSGLTFANKTGATVTVSVTVYDGTNDTYLGSTLPIAANDTVIFGGENWKLSLPTGWSIRCICNTASAVDAVASVVQFT